MEQIIQTNCGKKIYEMDSKLERKRQIWLFLALYYYNNFTNKIGLSFSANFIAAVK